MMKKLFAIMLVAIMVFAVAGCGGGNNPATPTPVASSGAASSAPAASSGAGTTTTATSGDPIKIGHWSYLTGTNATLGDALTKGAKLAVKHMNEKGGIKGRPVELITYDMKGEPTEGFTVVNRLIDQDKVNAIIGGCSSPTQLSLIPVVEEKKVINTCCGVSPAITNIGNKYSFRSTNSSKMTDQGTVDGIAGQGAKKVGMLTINSDYGQLGKTNFEKAFNDLGIEFMCEFFDKGAVDVGSQVAKLLNAKCDQYIMYCSNDTDMIMSYKEMRKQGWTNYIWSTESSSSPTFRSVGGKEANGAIYVTTTVIPEAIDDAVTAEEKQFLTDFVAEYGALPLSDVSYRAYDGGMLIWTAMNAATDANDPDAVSDAFFKISGYKGVQGTWDFTDKSGDGLKAANTYVIDGGKNVPLKNWTKDLKEDYGWK
ncbi:ABC transporter substrate-binding protein [Clostridia bacterium OttesenSCG-928-F22]|nr:ABC transporter substrate-binding protein [Clostridia bacterium OttesenSCG-928-F22]